MSRLPISLLGAEPDAPFPPAERALREPDGLLAAGGDLSPTRLLNAYRRGIFPWYSPGQPILWWSPDPRMVFATNGVRLPSKFRRQLRHSRCQRVERVVIQHTRITRLARVHQQGGGATDQRLVFQQERLVRSADRPDRQRQAPFRHRLALDRRGVLGKASL